MIQMLLSSPAQIIAFWEEGPTDICLVWGNSSIKSFISGYPRMGVLPGPTADSKTLGFSEGWSEVQSGTNAGKDVVKRWQD